MNLIEHTDRGWRVIGPPYDDGHEDVTSAIQCGLFGFCGCGRPEDNLRAVRSALQLLVDSKTERDALRATEGYLSEAWNARFKAQEKKWVELFGASKYFIWYWLSQHGFTEHVGSVPGWLTPKGEDLLSDLNEWHKEHADE